MSFESVINDKLLKLPVTQTNSYRHTIKELFKGYNNLIGTLTDEDIQISGLKSNNKIAGVIKHQKSFTEGILEAIDCYYDGKPHDAYVNLMDSLEVRTAKYNSTNPSNFLNSHLYNVGENFYRIRRSNTNFPYDSKEMFHIPFEYRGKVTTQRYSIPGFPSLYIGRSLYMCWEELNRPNISDFQAVRLETAKSLHFLDLTAPQKEDFGKTKEGYKYLMTWPLIAACTVKVNNYNDPFKAEYIIPQLLLQWIRNNNAYDGIKYYSTHISNYKSDTDSELFNYVLPVKDNLDEGLCNSLAEAFLITPTLSWQLMQYTTGGQIFIHSKSEYEPLNKLVPPMELIKGRKNLYSSSTLGNLELNLIGMDTYPIEKL